MKEVSYLYIESSLETQSQKEARQKYALFCPRIMKYDKKIWCLSKETYICLYNYITWHVHIIPVKSKDTLNPNFKKSEPFYFFFFQMILKVQDGKCFIFCESNYHSQLQSKQILEMQAPSIIVSQISILSFPVLICICLLTNHCLLLAVLLSDQSS